MEQCRKDGRVEKEWSARKNEKNRREANNRRISEREEKGKWLEKDDKKRKRKGKNETNKNTAHLISKSKLSFHLLLFNIVITISFLFLPTHPLPLFLSLPFFLYPYSYSPNCVAFPPSAHRLHHCLFLHHRTLMVCPFAHCWDAYCPGHWLWSPHRSNSWCFKCWCATGREGAWHGALCLMIFQRIPVFAHFRTLVSVEFQISLDAAAPWNSSRFLQVRPALCPFSFFLLAACLWAAFLYFSFFVLFWYLKLSVAWAWRCLDNAWWFLLFLLLLLLSLLLSLSLFMLLLLLYLYISGEFHRLLGSIAPSVLTFRFVSFRLVLITWKLNEIWFSIPYQYFTCYLSMQQSRHCLCPIVVVSVASFVHWDSFKWKCSLPTMGQFVGIVFMAMFH